MKRLIVTMVAALALLGIVPSTMGQGTTVICYNCPPEWADWASQLKAIKE